MTHDTILPFSFPAVHAKKVAAAFDGGRFTSNGGVMLLGLADRRLGLANRRAGVFPDRRDPTRIVHGLADMFRARMFAVCCGYEDTDDLDHLRCDPAFKLACPAHAGDRGDLPPLTPRHGTRSLAVVRRGLRALFDARQDFEVCAEASDGRGAVELALHQKPDVAILNIYLPVVNGIDATRKIRHELSATEVLILASCQGENEIRDALHAGALGYGLRSDADEQISGPWRRWRCTALFSRIKSQRHSSKSLRKPDPAAALPR